MNGKPSGHPCLALLLALACAFTLAPGFAAYAAEVNYGTVKYGHPGNPHIAPDGYENRGSLFAGSGSSGGTALTVTSGGFDNHGTVTASGVYNTNAIGIRVLNGGFFNRGTGTVTAEGHRINSFGIYVENGSFTNSGIVNAYGESSGTGIFVGSGGFFNYLDGTLTASGENNGIGIHVDSGGFFNYRDGTLTACGDSSGGIGIRIVSGGFENQGTLFLTDSGTSILLLDDSGNDIRLSKGSLTAFGGGLLTWVAEARPSLSRTERRRFRWQRLRAAKRPLQ